MNTIFSRTSKNAQRFFFALAAMISIVGGFFVANAVFAAHTATVTVNPTFVKGNQPSTYSFNIFNNGAGAIYKVTIAIPSGFTSIANASCPTGMTSTEVSATQVVCLGDPFEASTQIASGASAQLSFNATSPTPSSDTSYSWTIITRDTTGASVSNTSAQTNVDTTSPTISSITTKDTNSDGKVDTATVVFSEPVLDSSFVAGNFSIGGSAGTSISTGTADDNTFDVLVLGGVAGTNAKDVTYTQGNGSDIVGNPLANVVTGTIVEIDGAAPVFMSARTQSPTTIDLTFSEDLLGTTITNADFSVVGFTLTTPDATDTGTPGIVHLTVSSPFGTGETPHVSYTGMVKDNPGLNTAPNRSDVTPSDGIAPVIASTRTVSTTAIEVTFTEAMSAVSKDDFTVAGNTVSSVIFTSGITATLNLGTPIGTGAIPLVSIIATPTGTKDNASIPNTVTGGLTSTPLDGIAPTVVITATSAISPTKTAPIAMTVTFSESVTGFDPTDIVVGNGTVGNFAGSGSTYAFDITTPGQGTVIVNIAGGIAQDANSNVNTIASQFSIVFDNVPPTVTSIILADPSLKVGETSLVTITFSEKVTGFDNADITTIGNGTLTNVSTSDEGKTWTATFTPTNDITEPSNIITVTKTGVTDLAGNAGVGTTDSGNYAIDTVRPTVVVSLDDSALKAGDTAIVTFTFSEAPTLFDSTDVTVNNGTIGDVSTTADPLVFTATLTPTVDAEVSTNAITIGTNWTDLSGNNPLASVTSANYSVETKKPTVILSSATVNPTNGLIAVTATFSEVVTGFVAGDITVGNGAVENFTAVSGTNYTFDVNPTDGANVAVTIQVLADKAIDAAENNNVISNELTRTSDTVAPTVSLTKDHSDLVVRDADTVVITATFNEAMTSGPTITIGTLVTNVAMTHRTGNNWTYEWNVPSDNTGSVDATVAGSDVAGNAYSDSTNLTFTIDNVLPIMAITAPTTVATGSTVITFTNDSDATPTVAQCSIDNSLWVACTSGVTTLGDVTGFNALSDVPFTLYLRDVDVAGNTGVNQLALAKDTAAPSISSKTPVTNGVGIDPSSNIMVVFNEDVVITNAQVTLKKGTNDAVITVVDFVSGTKTATINPSSSLDNNSTYTVTLAGVIDTVGNVLPTTAWSFTTSASYSIDLTTGWNLISLPVVPTNTLVSSVLGNTLNDVAKVQSIWKYDPATNDWNVYHPDNSGETSDFTTMTAGEGYWVDYRAETTGTISGTGNLFQAGGNVPPQKALSAGWNLIGYYQIENTTNISATKALSTVAGQWTQLRTYGNTDKQFHSVLGTTEMKPGEGYWIFMKSSSYAPYLYGPGDTN
ncbi:MAG: Ig-like domain-containing protein [Candidatus Parcubacteria bacterium]|nr:Ig-like domain-containing protein [Candidatus Parcubacteria bacterium]